MGGSVPDESEPRRPSHAPAGRLAEIGVAVLAVAAAALARWFVDRLIGTKLPFLTFFPAVMTAALLCGWRAGAVATALSAVVSVFWLEPFGQFQLDKSDAIGLALFVLTCGYIVGVAEWMRRAKARERGALAGQKRSEVRLQQFLESISDGFAAFDRDWRIVYINRAAAALVNLRPQDVLGRSHWDVFPQAAGTEIETTYRRAVAERVALQFITFYPPHDRWYEISAYPTDDGLSVFFQNATDKVTAQRMQREADERFRAAVDAGRIGTWDWDMAADRVTWSDRIYEFHGLAPGEFGGTVAAFGELVHPDDRSRLKAAMDRAVAERTPYAAEFRTVRPTGEVRWLATHGRVLFDEHGKPARLLGATVDVTDRRSADEEKSRLLASERAARSQAEHASRMKDEFLATLSHELRTPLSAILGWSQLLRRDDGNALDLRQGLETIERNARAQTQLIEDLLDMSRIVAGQLRLDVQPVHLSDVIESAIQTVAPAAAARSIRLEKVLDPRAGPVSGDPARLQQVVWNLLANAIKFTPKGGKAQVTLACVNSHVELSVADTGEGIAPEFLPYVFDRFRQGDGTTTRRHGGLGLGLSIVKSLVEMHGGTVRAKSPGVGLGATFTVLLPLAATHPPPATGEPRLHPRAHKAVGVVDPAGAPATSLDGLRVLIVDDEADARVLIRRVLEGCGAQVSDVASAAEGLQAMGEFRPDVLVSDIGMPEVDGYEFIARVRALGETGGGKIPAVALTAFARSEDRTRALLAGYLVHVSKPVEPSELIATVASAAGRTGYGPRGNA